MSLRAEGNLEIREPNHLTEAVMKLRFREGKRLAQGHTAC